MSYSSENPNYKGKTFELYGAAAVNPPKIQVLFEELGVSYKYHHIDIFKGEQYNPDFVKINPNNKVPIIIDHELLDVDGKPLVLYESGAILIYLAEKFGKFLPSQTSDPIKRAQVFKWLVWQVACLGPMNGQYIHYSLFEQDNVPPALLRYLKESEKLFKILDQHLATNDYLVGNELTIADIAVWGWALYLPHGISVPDTPESYLNIKRWLDRLNSRPAFKKILDRIIPPLQAEIKEFTHNGKLPFKTLEQVQKDYELSKTK